ncbi:MAG TPA: Gfo/Idh/MocA family oxidoreductase [Candidatus Acidoferrum sp.]|nr:Gfo/Idh/MocA family oxidoreductase [Candidatus Acidoferrum sp.]
MGEPRIPKIAVIGCGYWGQNLVRDFAGLGALAAVCDADSQKLEKLVVDAAVMKTPRFEDVLERRDIEAVVIAAPAAQHFALAKKALLAGKDAFVEKPLALHLEEGKELVELAQKRGRILMVGHLLHYHPAINELRRMLHSGELGRVEYISSSRLNLGKLRTEEDILWSFAPHDISAILYLLEETPTRVVAQGASYLNHPISDVTLTILNFASGVKAHIFVSWLHPFKEQKLVVVGNKKMVVFDDTQAEQKLVVYSHRVDWINRMPVARKAEGEVIPLSKEQPLKIECQHFLGCVRDRKTPNTDGENGLKVLAILHAAGKSIRENGHPVSMNPPAAPRFYVDPRAVVDEPCEIGDGTKIWHFSHVMKDCQIGAKCNLGQNVHVASGVRIGDNVKIQNNVSLYAGVELEDDVFCGPSMVFTNVTTPRSHVNRRSEYQRTLVRKGASLGANSTIVCGTTIGEYAFIGAGAVVTRDVPRHALMVGVPARRIGWVCQCGVTLQMESEKGTCSECGKNYILQGEDISLMVEDVAPNFQPLQRLAASAGAD